MAAASLGSARFELASSLFWACAANSGSCKAALPALDPLAGLTHQDAADHRLVSARILADNQYAGAAIESAAMEDRAPLQPEVFRRVCARARNVLAERGERLVRVAGIGPSGHYRVYLLNVSAACVVRRSDL
jgi:hypothetical protein